MTYVVHGVAGLAVGVLVTLVQMMMVRMGSSPHGWLGNFVLPLFLVVAATLAARRIGPREPLTRSKLAGVKFATLLVVAAAVGHALSVSWVDPLSRPVDAALRMIMVGLVTMLMFVRGLAHRSTR